MCNHCPIKILPVRIYVRMYGLRNDRLPAARRSSSHQMLRRKRSLPFAKTCARASTWETDQRRRERFNVAINNRYLLTECRRRRVVVTFPRHLFRNLSRGFCRLKLVPSNNRARSYPRRVRQWANSGESVRVPYAQTVTCSERTTQMTNETQTRELVEGTERASSSVQLELR